MILGGLKMKINRSTKPAKAIKAGEEVTITDEASELLFETQDVADLLAEVTGEDVDVTADEEEVTFAIGDDEFVVTPDEDEEILECKRVTKKAVKASKRRPVRRVIKR